MRTVHRFKNSSNGLTFDPRNYYSWVDTGIDTNEEAASDEVEIDCDADPTTAIPTGTIIKIEDELMAVTNSANPALTVTRTDAVVHATNQDIYKRVNNCVLYLEGQQDAVSGTIKDLSGYGNHGTITGATDVRIGSGLRVKYFDGTDDYITCGDGVSLDCTTGLTMMCWINTSVAGSNTFIMGRDSAASRNYYLLFSANQLAFICFVGDSAVTSGNDATTAFAQNKWVFVAGTFSTTSKVLSPYVNAVLGATQASNGPIDNDDVSLMIGCRVGLDRDYTGYQWGNRVFNREFTATEIARIFNQERSLFNV